MRHLAHCLLLFACSVPAGQLTAQEAVGETRQVDLRNGAITLHYIEYGEKIPVVFIHGGLEDCLLWRDQAKVFGEHYRAIAYSRRYNYPNENKPIDRYSPKLEADDLAEFIRELNLGRCHIVGFSYGGTVALFLAIDHPELVRSLTLAEPALVPWFKNLPEPNASKGKEVHWDYYRNLVDKACLSFSENDTEGALRVTLDYLSSDKGFFDRADPRLKEVWRRNVRELEMIYTTKSGLLTPNRQEVEALKMPRLLLSGEKSADSCQLAVGELERLLSVKRHRLKGAGHAVWLDAGEECNEILLKFLSEN